MPPEAEAPPLPDQASRRVARIADLGGSRRIVAGRHGSFLVHASDRFIGQSMIRYGEWSEGEVDIFRQIVRPGDTVIEAGANIGVHTVPLARMVGDGGHVVAYEPQPANHLVLCANLALNGVQRVEPRMKGVGARRETIMIAVIDRERSSNSGGFEMRAHPGDHPAEIEPLDEAHAGRPVRLIKADVEGMEAEVIDGARDLIATQRPFLHLECDVPERMAPLLERLWAQDYDAYWHVVPLYNPTNWFGESENIHPRLGSWSVLAISRHRKDRLGGITPIRPGSAHPMTSLQRERAAA